MQTTIEKTLEKITSKGYKAFVVGGYPRDLLLNRKSVDIDICTSATPRDLKEIFPDLTMPKICYGAVTIIVNKIRFELTTFRTEKKYKDFRKPSEVHYTSDLLIDIKRRDFTINTICMDKDGNILDLLDAKKDINNKLVKMVGDPKKRLKEDVLRILRAIRFATILDFNLDSELEKYIIKYGDLLSNLSYERKKEELDKIFASKNSKYGIELLLRTGLDKHLELNNLASVVITSSIIGIWAQLDAFGKYNFNAHDADTINRINEMAELEFNTKNIYKYGLYVSSLAAEIRGIERRKVTTIHSSLPIRSRNDIRLNGNDIALILKKKPGPYIKEIISDLESKIISLEIKNEETDLKDYILSKYM